MLCGPDERRTSLTADIEAIQGRKDSRLYNVLLTRHSDERCLAVSSFAAMHRYISAERLENCILRIEFMISLYSFIETQRKGASVVFNWNDRPASNEVVNWAPW